MRNTARRWKASTTYSAYVTTIERQMPLPPPYTPNSIGPMIRRRNTATIITIAVRTTAMIATTATTTPVMGPMAP